MFVAKVVGVGLAVILLAAAVATPALAGKGVRGKAMPYMSGEITKVDAAAQTIEVKDENGATRTFKITPRTEIETEKEGGWHRSRSHSSGEFSDLTAGAYVGVRYIGAGPGFTAHNVSVFQQ